MKTSTAGRPQSDQKRSDTQPRTQQTATSQKTGVSRSARVSRPRSRSQATSARRAIRSSGDPDCGRSSMLSVSVCASRATVS